MRAYGQFCPVARTAELFAERWTPIIVRNLLNGCRTFSEIRQGAPGIPTALLAQRLEILERAGIVSREPGRLGRGWLEIEPPELCTKAMGYVEDIVAYTDSACLINIHLSGRRIGRRSEVVAWSSTVRPG